MNYYVNFLEGIGKVAWEPWGDKGAESATLCQDSQATLLLAKQNYVDLNLGFEK